MAISSVTSVPDYGSPPSISPLPDGGQSTATGGGSNDISSIVNAIQESASAEDPIAMLDALKQIGGSGSANIAALVNVAETSSAENVDGDLVRSIGTNGNGAIYSVLQNVYSASRKVALYLHPPQAVA